MPDFNVLTPPLSITNPTSLPLAQYPRHVHKAGGLWLEVRSEEDAATAVADGWSLTPVAPKAHKK